MGQYKKAGTVAKEVKYQVEDISGRALWIPDEQKKGAQKKFFIQKRKK